MKDGRKCNSTKVKMFLRMTGIGKESYDGVILAWPAATTSNPGIVCFRCSTLQKFQFEDIAVNIRAT
jgi:hypothetical protein